VTGRHGASIPHIRLVETPPNRMIAIATLDRGPEALGIVHQALGRWVAAGEGTGSAFFERGIAAPGRRNEQESDGGGGCLSLYIIHMIAIRKSVPVPEAG
jgi:hypothetical protein